MFSEHATWPDIFHKPCKYLCNFCNRKSDYHIRYNKYYSIKVFAIYALIQQPKFLLQGQHKNIRENTYTIQLHLSGLIGTAIHSDMQKTRIIGIFFENRLHWQFEVEKKIIQTAVLGYILDTYLNTHKNINTSFLIRIWQIGENLRHKNM
jgi:hypothetical protein